MDSPYKRNENRRKNSKSNTTITQTQSQNTNESNKIIKNNKTNDTLEGGNPDNVRLSGEELIEQAFQDDKENKNHPEGNTKVFTLARKKVDNV